MGGAMTSAELDALVRDLGEHVDAAAYSAEGWRGFLDRFIEVFPGANIGFARQSFGDRAHSFAHFSGFDPDFVEAFGAHYAAINPFTSVMAALRPGQIVIANTFLPIRTYSDTEFVADWLEPQAAMNSANVKLAGTPDSVAWISSHYDDRLADEYDPMMERVLHTLRPRLTRAMATGDRLASATDVSLRRAALLGNETEPALILDEKGRVLDVNASAEEALGTGHLLRLLGNRLILTDERARTWLAGALLEESVAPFGAAFGMHEHHLRHTAVPTLLHLAPLPTFVVETWPMSLETGRRYLLLIRQPGQTDPLARLQPFARRYALSPAETRLCLALVEGLSLSDAADRLAITRNTVRDRLKAIFRKTGTSRQSELILRILKG